MLQKKKQKQLSGSAKMYRLGKKPILLWVTPEELEVIRAAAAGERRPVAQFVVYHSLQAAEAINTDRDAARVV
jgi:uncharacterized protein (DUF1778 family)